MALRAQRWLARGLWTVVAAMVIIGLDARAARAYVRYASASGSPFHWAGSCIPMTAYPDDLTGLAPDQTMHAAQAAAATWSSADNACTYLGIDIQRASGPAPAVGFDGHNIIAFRSKSWCAPNSTTGACTNYDPALLALTSIFVTSGQVVEADIEVNAVNSVWTDLDIDPTAVNKQDLQNELTRQLGHVIGLDRPCYLTGTVTLDASGHPLDIYGRPMIDNLGQPVPDCSVAPQAALESTMFPSQAPGDTSRRTLAADDLQALCDIYPEAEDPHLCASTDADAGVDGGPADGALSEGGAIASDGGGMDGMHSAATDAAPITDAKATPDSGRDGAAGPASGGGCGCGIGAGGTRADLLSVGLALLALAARSRFPRRQDGRRACRGSR